VLLVGHVVPVCDSTVPKYHARKAERSKKAENTLKKDERVIGVEKGK
jgi:hypothetical protein